MIDLFEIGVSMSMTNGISGILGVITKDLFGVQHEIDKTSGMFSKMNLAIGGMVGLLGGAGILGAMWKLERDLIGVSRLGFPDAGWV